MPVSVDQRKTGNSGQPHLGTFTWATLPAAASWSGYTARVSDVGIAPGLLVVSDGTNWRPAGVQVLSRSGATANVTGTTNETTLASVTVPGGLLGLNGQLRVRASWQVNATAGTKTARLRYGGTLFWTLGFTSSVNGEEILTLRAAGATNAQRCNTTGSSGITGPTANGFANGAVDSTVDQPLILTAQLATGTDSMTLVDYAVEVLA